MKNRTRKLFAELMAVAMTVTLIPGTASAEIIGMVNDRKETEAQSDAAQETEIVELQAAAEVLTATADTEGILTIQAGAHVIRLQAQAGVLALDAEGLSVETAEGEPTADVTLKDNLYYAPKEAISAEGAVSAEAVTAVTHFTLEAAADGTTILRAYAGEQELDVANGFLLIIKEDETEAGTPESETGETGAEESTEAGAGEPATETETDEPATEAGTEAGSETGEAETEESAEPESETGTGMESESESEAATEEGTEEESESETESEEYLNELIFENEEVKITVTATDEAQLPMNTELAAEKLAEDSEEYLEAKAAADEASGADPATTSYSFYNLILLSDGQSLQPESGTVSVQMTFKNIKPEENSEQNVFHIEDTENGKVAENITDTTAEGDSLESRDVEI